ncbi:MAG: hypothetical protein KF729_34530 [Sandaracinaceae bacterium]|nr:hypothetical protein [Sandaracinaceae bacterium]
MRAFAALALALFGSAHAAADDLSPPPERCPRGAVGTTEHAGEWCAATRCERDADCTGVGLRRQGLGYSTDGSRVCREAALCVVEEQYTLGGLHAAAPPTSTRRVARGECLDGRCPAGGECRAERRCVLASEASPAPAREPDRTAREAPAAAPREPPPSGCASAASRRARGGLLVSIVALAAWRRRPRGGVACA